MEPHVLIGKGSGIHVTHNKERLSNVITLNNPPKYGVGNEDKPVDIIGSGYLNIKINEKEYFQVQAFLVPGEDATILSAGTLYQESKQRITLTEGYKYLRVDGKLVPIQNWSNTAWVKANDILQFPEMIKDYIKIWAIKPNNPLLIKPSITLLEAHLRLNHIPSQLIKKSIENNIFDDITVLDSKKK